MYMDISTHMCALGLMIPYTCVYIHTFTNTMPYIPVHVYMGIQPQTRPGSHGILCMCVYNNLTSTMPYIQVPWVSSRRITYLYLHGCHFP